MLLDYILVKLYVLTSDDKYRNSALKIYRSINDGENKGLGNLYYQFGLKYYGNRNVYTFGVLGYSFYYDMERMMIAKNK